MEVLDAATWRGRAAAHEARLAPYVAPHLARRQAGERHPVHDFLFTYYSQRPAQLLRWHPGHGTALRDADEYVELKGYEVLARLGHDSTRTSHDSTVMGVAPTYVAGQRALLEATRRLLVATAGRAVHTGCFGLHEWAMVYHADETRHPQPLRLGRTGTDAVVESHRVACSHFDAFRFFTDDARPRNTLRPGRDDREQFEQPGCLHAGMDLYKHAFRLTPMICSDLVADCFELAWDIRQLDMRAAPYDLQAFGYEPVRIETPEGKQEYAAAQRGFAERAAPLRSRLVAECERLLAVSVAP